MDKITFEYYTQNTEDIFSRYEDAEANTLLPHIFSEGDSVLDIGCASGRDMALLYSLGIDVYGIDPIENFQYLAYSVHPELKGRIFQGFVPDNLPNLPREKFDAILLSAVLMHIPEGELFDTAINIRSLLKEGGKLVVSIPIRRDDLKNLGHSANQKVFEDMRDQNGRLMIIRPEARIRLIFERLGFDTESRYQSEDRLGRNGIQWISLIFRYRGSGISESVDKIESIINQDRKTATYKLALLRALCDIAQKESHSAWWDTEGKVHIPINSVARKWIEYYWPIIEADKFIPQMRGEEVNGSRFIGFRRELFSLTEIYKKNGGLGLEEFVFQRDENKIIAAAKPILHRTVGNVKKAIQQPIKYAGGGDSNDKPFLYSKKDESVVLKADLWRELLLLGHIIGDTLVLRWAELTADISKNVSIAEMVELLLKEVKPERNVNNARAIYKSLQDLECVWTGESLSRCFDVDHAIPYVLRHDNSLWNLFPSKPSVNNEKRDKIPDTALVERRNEIILYYWGMLKTELPGQFESDYTRITGQKILPKNTWHKELFSVFLEIIETTAVTRNIPRWYGA
jgi:SAM-dependent methyltransferase